MLVSKRHLTQTEKHRRYVDAGSNTAKNQPLRDSAFRFTECPQNLAQSRKLQNTVQEIEKQQSKSLAKINGEKHLLKLKYKGLLKNENYDHDIAETFFLQPGFRFHRNGEARKIRDPRVMPEIEPKLSRRSLLSLAKSNRSSQSLGSQSSKGQSQKSVSGESAVSTREQDGPVKKERVKDINVDKMIEEIEQDLKNIRNDKELIDINRRIRNVRSSLTFVRAHANDYAPNIPFIVQDHQNMFSNARNPSECPSGSGQRTDRFSKHYTKINCPACENRLKHNDARSSSPEEPPTKHMQRWQFAPRGTYVSQLESKDSKGSKLRSSKSAKTSKQIESTKDSNTSISDKRISKSAHRSEQTSQRNKVKQRALPTGSTPKVKPQSVLDKFKTRENLNRVPQQTQSENEVGDQAWKGAKERHHTFCPISSPEMFTPGYEVELKSKKSSDSMASHGSKEEVAKNDMDSRVSDFCNKLPDVKPSITTWRKSSGQLITWKPCDKLRGSKSPRECKMTWAEYQQSKRDVSLEHELQYKFYISSQEKPSGDPNSIEELSKCRYLRDFKMRKNLPEK